MEEESENASLVIDQDFDKIPPSPQFNSSVKAGAEAQRRDQIEGILETHINQLNSLISQTNQQESELLKGIASKPLEQKLVSLLDFLIDRYSNSSLEIAKLQNEAQKAREEQSLSETRCSRLLHHLQQNVRLLSRIATNEGETTLIQEADKNMQAMSQADSKKDYLKQLAKALIGGTDQKAGIEVMELLKQEISINSIMRRQTQLLQQKSEQITLSLNDMKTKISAPSNEKKIVRNLCQIAECNEADLETSIQGMKSQMIQAKKRSDSIQAEFEGKISSLQKENEALRSASYDEEKVREARMKLFDSIGIRAKVKTEIDGLIFAANKASEQISEHKKACSVLKCQPTEILSAVSNILEETKELKRVQEQNQSLMAKQACTIQELQKNSWAKWSLDLAKQLKIDNPEKLGDYALKEAIASKIFDAEADVQKESEAEEPGIRFDELDQLHRQFSSLEQELVELQGQMASK